MTASTIWPAQLKHESCFVGEKTCGLTVVLVCRVPVVRVLRLIFEALKGKVLVFQQPQRRPQLETLLEVRDEGLAREVKLGMDIVGPVSLQKC